MLDKRLNDKGKNWRHVLKSLKVLDYCLHEGSELVVTWARKNIYIIKTLREFQYVDDDGKDVGQNGQFSMSHGLYSVIDKKQYECLRRNSHPWSWMKSDYEPNVPIGRPGNLESPVLKNLDLKDHPTPAVVIHQPHNAVDLSGESKAQRKRMPSID